MVKITSFLAGIGLLLAPLSAFALFGFDAGEQSRKEIVSKMKDIDPTQIKTNKLLGFDLTRLVKQLYAELESKKSSELPVTLSPQAIAVLVRFLDPDYGLAKHPAIQKLIDYFKEYLRLNPDNTLQEKIDTLIHNANAAAEIK